MLSLVRSVFWTVETAFKPVLKLFGPHLLKVLLSAPVYIRSQKKTMKFGSMNSQCIFWTKQEQIFSDSCGCFQVSLFEASIVWRPKKDHSKKPWRAWNWLERMQSLCDRPERFFWRLLKCWLLLSIKHFVPQVAETKCVNPQPFWPTWTFFPSTDPNK